MREHGWERGAPSIFLVPRGGGVIFPLRVRVRTTAEANADAICGKAMADLSVGK
jgi:hypothetical protein